MQKTFENQVNRPVDFKKDKNTERNHIFYYKKRSAIRKLLEMAKNFDQDIYICLHDKK
jgi:hypothetical protein